jgi:iron-sulfur cluster assembly accessory protein
MLQEIDTKFVVGIETPTLTDAASSAVLGILKERNLEGYALRVYVSGGGCGCSGVNFGMALDNNFRDVDTTFDISGVKVVVDEVSIDYLRGATIDFVNDPVRGAGFAVDSPNAKSHEHSHGEEGCGCGGSCSCQN